MKTGAAPRSGGLSGRCRTDEFKRAVWKAPLLGLLTSLFLVPTSPCLADPVIIGSKKFTESYVLAEIAKRTIANTGVAAAPRQGRGGTIPLWQGLRADQTAAYPECPGTMAEEILKAPPSIPAEERR